MVADTVSKIMSSVQYRSCVSFQTPTVWDGFDSIDPTNGSRSVRKATT